MVRATRKSLPISFYHIVCEGDSEVFYLEKLGQFLHSKGIHLETSIKPYSPKKTKNKCVLTDPLHLLEYAKRLKKDKDEFQHPDVMCVLLDEDVFIRGKYNKNDFIQQCSLCGVTPLFQKNNFEDFLICHLDSSKIECWKAIVSGYDAPMTDKEIMDRIVNIIPNYKKGSIPLYLQERVFSIEAFKQVISISADVKMPFMFTISTVLQKFVN